VAVINRSVIQTFGIFLVMVIVTASCQSNPTAAQDGVMQTRIEEIILQPASSATLELVCEPGYNVSESSGHAGRFIELVEVSQRNPQTVWFTFNNKSDDTAKGQVVMRITCKILP